MPFYGVALAPKATQENDTQQEAEAVVVETKEEALRLVKNNKGSRFKHFETREEAESFANDAVNEFNSELRNCSQTSVPNGNEPSCVFPSLKPQELKGLKDAINAKDLQQITQLIDSNPRYLVTTCDTPAILHSGTRANALHFAAASGNIRVAELVLDKIQDKNLLRKMYPNESEESLARREEHLLDLYLNTPNKGHNDTPLHQACKSGHLEVIRLLVSFSSCDTQCKNKEDKTPAEVACTRDHQNDLDLRREIEKLLAGQVYIPVIRDSDLVHPPFIGEAWSPHQKNNTDDYLASSENDTPSQPSFLLSSPIPKRSLHPQSPYKLNSPIEVISKPKGSPLHLHAGSSSPLPSNQISVGRPSIWSPLSVRALLGPVTPEEAGKMRQEWNSSLDKHKKLEDPLKGIEKQGRVLARKYAVNMLEYWDFLGAYCDLTKSDGLVLLNNHLYSQAQKIRRDDGEDNVQCSDSFSNDEDYEFSTRNGNNSFLENTLSPVSELVKELKSFHITSPPIRAEHKIEVGKVKGLAEAEESDEDEECFQSFSTSPASSNSSYVTVDGVPDIYIFGKIPTTTDLEVYDALKDTFIDQRRYPNVYQWRELVSERKEEITKRSNHNQEKKMKEKHVPPFDISQCDE